MTTQARSFFARVFPEKRRSRTNPQGPLEGLKTLAIVIPLTILIWVYAERAQTQNEPLSVLIAFTTSNANFAATVPAVNESITLTLEGPRGQIEQFKKNMQELTRDSHLELALPNGDATVGTKTIILAQAIKADPHFASLNVTVKTAPQELRVSVDPVISKVVTVAQPANAQVSLQNVSFDPPRVTVTGPTPLLNDDFSGDNPTISIDTSNLDLSTTTAPRTATVPLIRPNKSRIQLSASQVKMTYEVGSTIRSGEIKTVYIDVRRPISEDGRSKVIIRGSGGPVIHNVQVTGPSDVVSQLIGDNPVLPVKAVLTITREDIDKGELRHPVDFDLKKGVTVTGGPYEVTFEVRSIPSTDTDR